MKLRGAPALADKLGLPDPTFYVGVGHAKCACVSSCSFLHADLDHSGVFGSFSKNGIAGPIRTGHVLNCHPEGNQSSDYASCNRFSFADSDILVRAWTDLAADALRKALFSRRPTVTYSIGSRPVV